MAATWISEPRRSAAFPKRTASPSHASSPASPSWQRRPRGQQSPGIPGHSQGERPLHLTPQALHRLPGKGGHVGNRAPAFRGIPKENGLSISRLKPCIAFLAKAATWVPEPGVPGHSQGERRLRLTPQALHRFLAKAATWAPEHRRSGEFPRRTASPSHVSSPASPSWLRRPRRHRAPAFGGIPEENGVSISRLKPCIAFLAEAATWAPEVPAFRGIPGSEPPAPAFILSVCAIFSTEVFFDFFCVF